jgi:hypothetical protein
MPLAQARGFCGKSIPISNNAAVAAVKITLDHALTPAVADGYAQ